MSYIPITMNTIRIQSHHTTEMAVPNQPHAIVFAYHYLGHITPTINVATRLASKGFAITYVEPEFIHRKANYNHEHFFAEARESGLDIRYKTISDAFPVEYDRDLNVNEYWESMIHDFPARVDELVGSVIKESDPSSGAFFLMADSLYTWPAEIAKRHNIVHVSLWTAPALVFCISYHLDLLRENGHLPCAGNIGNDVISYIPGVQSISTKDLLSFIQDPDILPILLKVVVKAFEQVKSADFILCNTVQELESEALSALNQNNPTYAIGPINFFPDITTTNNISKKSLWPESDCAEWLNTKPPGSVLYISFGSMHMLSEEDIEELAHGLLLSKVNFLWVTRPDSTNNVASRFGDLKDQGLIIPWCNQIVVLSNPAIGGFVTHCGWNSILESMWGGVPMMCYPLVVDQPTNRKVVVDDWKIGINLCDGGKIVRDEVVSKINILMKGEKSIDLRREARKVSETLRNALDIEGSSHRNFDQFVADLKTRLWAIITPKNA